MTIGDRIKKSRELKELSQTELAEIVGISKQTLYKYENDIVTNIPSDKIELIANTLCVTPAYLMGWEPPDPMADCKEFKKKRLRGQILGDLLELGLEDEHALLLDFQNLEPENRNKVLNYSKLLYNTQLAEYHAMYAAHERTDIAITEEMRKNDDDF